MSSHATVRPRNARPRSSHTDPTPSSDEGTDVGSACSPTPLSLPSLPNLVSSAYDSSQAATLQLSNVASTADSLGPRASSGMVHSHLVASCTESTSLVDGSISVTAASCSLGQKWPKGPDRASHLISLRET